MMGIQQGHEPHCCVNDHLHYVTQVPALPKKCHQPHVQTHRASCIAKKCDKAVNHMGEVIYLMSRMHAQVQSLKSLFLGVLHQMDQEENRYYNQPSYSEITYKLRTAMSPGERARIKVEARRQRLAARRACFKPKESSTGGIMLTGVDKVCVTQSPVRKIERYGDESCLIEYDDTVPPTCPGTPQLVVSDDMATSRSRVYHDASSKHSYSRSARKSPYVSAVCKLGTEKNEETSVWATLVNELTKEWKNSGTPIALLRYAQTSRQMARGTSGIESNNETHVTLSEISKITSIPDASSTIPKCSTSDILGPLHSTMIDIGDIRLEHSDDLFARNYRVHSVESESTASSMDLRETDLEIGENDSSAYSNGLPGISANSDFYKEPVPQRSGYCSASARATHEIIGASFIENNMAKKSTNHYSMEATCASAPDCGNLTIPGTDTSRSPLDSTREKSSSHSAIQSSYKESDLYSSDSSMHESDLEILQPKFKKPVGRPKRVQRNNIRASSDTDESHNVSAPMNTPDLTGSSNASNPQGDIVINNTKSNENFINFGWNNLSPPQESVDHIRPPCIGKLNTPAYQPIVVRNRLFNNITSDTDSGIGERPPCIGRSETPLNINVRGRVLKFESDDENDTENDSLDNKLDDKNSLILGDRPACLGKSMMEINQHLPKSMEKRPKSTDVDSGVSMSVLSPVVHLKNKKEPIPVRKPSSHQAKSRLHIGCVSSRADQTSEFSEEIEVLESNLVTKPNKKSFSRKLKTFGGIFNRNKRI